MSNCSAVSDKRRYLSSQHQGGYVLLTANVTELKSDSTRYDAGKAIKDNFALFAAGDARDMETFDSILSLTYLIQAVKFRWPTQI
jgi:hypothetical protein